MSALEGSLETFALPDVFRLVAQNHVTGALNVVRESGDGTVYFREGEVYYAFSSLTREFLGQRLVNAKLITQGQLLRILDEQKRSGNRKIGDILVEKGILSQELLDTFLKEQIQDAIFNVLQWDAGVFTFVPGEVSSQEVGLSVSVENLIMESSRRLEEWEVIQRKIPNMDVVVRMAPTPPEDAMEINIKPEEWTLLVLADGYRTVGDIAAASERSEFEACKILYGLVTAGLLDVATGARPHAPSAEPAVARSEAHEFERSFASPPQPVDTTRTAERFPETERPEPVATPELPAAEQAFRSEPVPVAASEPALTEPARSVEPEGQPQPEPQPEPIRIVAHEMPPAPEPQTAAVTASNGEASAPKKAGDPTVTKDMLLRLISGVKNL